MNYFILYSILKRCMQRFQSRFPDTMHNSNWCKIFLNYLKVKLSWKFTFSRVTFIRHHPENHWEEWGRGRQSKRKKGGFVTAWVEEYAIELEGRMFYQSLHWHVQLSEISRPALGIGRRHAARHKSERRRISALLTCRLMPPGNDVWKLSLLSSLIAWIKLIYCKSIGALINLLQFHFADFINVNKTQPCFLHNCLLMVWPCHLPEH